MRLTRYHSIRRSTCTLTAALILLSAPLLAASLLAASLLGIAAATEIVPVDVRFDEGAPIVAVAAGRYHTCILLNSGNVHCYGYNDYGQAEDYTGDATQVTAGDVHTCILLNSGNVHCYGYNGNGQAEDYTGGNATQVTAGSSHTCILLNSGNVDCYGYNHYGQATDYTGGNAIQVSGGGHHTCILLNSGNVDCYGGNTFGQAEDYTGGNASQVTTGRYHTCILLLDGNIHCYGYNQYGQAEDHTGGNATQVTAGSSHTCILLQDGNVHCYGNNDYGQAEDYTGGATQVSGGGLHTCILLNSGNVQCYGYNDYGQAEDYRFTLAPTAEGWQRELLASASITFTGQDPVTPGVDEDVIQVKASPNGSDARHYDLDLTVAGIEIPTLSVYTNGTVQESVNVDLLHVSPQTLRINGATVTVAAYADHHPEETVCLVYAGGACAAPAFVDPFNPTWIAEEGEAAHLTIGVRVTNADGHVMFSDAVRVPYAGQIVASIPPVEPPTAAQITGHVLDGDARDEVDVTDGNDPANPITSVPGAIVTAQREEGPCEAMPEAGSSFVTVTREDGRFEIPVPCSGTYALVAESPGGLYLQASAEVHLPAATDDELPEASVNLTLDRGTGALNVLVLDTEGNGVEDVRVTVTGVDTQAEPAPQQTTADGARFEGLPWGTYRVIIERPYEYDSLGATRYVTVRPGGDSIAVGLLSS